MRMYQFSKFMDQHQTRLLAILLALTYIALYLTLFYPYQGEEGVYTVQSYEMWYHRQYLIPLEYGAPYWRPPLYNWLIINLSNQLGWDHMLQASRIIAATATLLTGGLLYQFTKRLFQDPDFAKFTVLLYLSGDLLFRRGWLAYSDSLFSLWVALSICSIWLAIRENRIRFVILANIALIAGVLTKAIIIYAFYILAVAILSLNLHKVRFFFKPKVILIHLIALLVIGLWFYIIPSPNHGLGMINDIVRQFSSFNFRVYSWLFISKPLDLFIHLTPFSFIALVSVFFVRNGVKQDSLNKKNILNCLWIFTLCYLPFWLNTTATPMRYIQPLYFLLAIPMAAAIWYSRQSIIRISIFFMIATVILKYALSLEGGNLFSRYHANFKETAKEIVLLTQGSPLYVKDRSFTGFSLVSHIDPMIYPSPPITIPPAQLQNGFIISKTFDPEHEHLVQSYPITAKDTIYLICIGNACDAPSVATEAYDDRPK